jgi:ketosteroid isomerase-like protein
MHASRLRDTGWVISQSNVEVVRALTDLWNEGERSVPSQYLDRAVEVESPFSSVTGEPYRGYAGIERWVRDIDEQFAEWQLDLHDVRDAGAVVLAVGRLNGRGRGSGIELDQACAALMDFGSGHLVKRVRIYWDVGAAFKDAGLER